MRVVNNIRQGSCYSPPPVECKSTVKQFARTASIHTQPFSFVESRSTYLLKCFRLEKLRAERENEMFPDEMDTPMDQTARVRFQR